MTKQQTLSCITAAVTALMFSTGTFAADKTAYDQAKASAKSTYDASHKQCESMSGNAKDICVAEAKAARVKTESMAEADYKGTAKATYKAKEDIAEADYKVAKERCDDKAGNDKDVCVKEAKAVETKAKADAKAERDTKKASAEATDDKKTAAYKAEAEKCDSLAGDAKTACVNSAKAKYNM
jgi:hypothetical protein